MGIVDDLRRMVGAGAAEYTIGDVTYWTDEQLAGLLAENRIYNHRVLLEPLADVQDGARVLLKARVCVAGTIDPDSPGTLRNASGATVAGWTIDRRGLVTFEHDAGWGRLMWSGDSYDTHAAAAEALTAWAAAVQLHYDVQADGQSMSRSQKHRQLMVQARQHWARALVGSFAL